MKKKGEGVWLYLQMSGYTVKKEILLHYLIFSPVAERVLPGKRL